MCSSLSLNSFFLCNLMPFSFSNDDMPFSSNLSLLRNAIAVDAANCHKDGVITCGHLCMVLISIVLVTAHVFLIRFSVFPF